jgi:rSAM/selenodomain-associated transferase 2
VVDGGSTDGTIDLATPLCSRLIHSEPGRALQMNVGAAVASGSYIFFLHADSRPTITADELQRALDAKPQWGFFAVKLSGAHWMFRVVERAMNLRSAFTRVATGDQVIFVHRELFESSGGFADIPLMEDIELCKRLRQEGAPQRLAQPVETSSRRWEEGGIVSTVLRMWSLRLAYFLGVSPARLKAYYADG